MVKTLFLYPHHSVWAWIIVVGHKYERYIQNEFFLWRYIKPLKLSLFQSQKVGLSSEFFVFFFFRLYLEKRGCINLTRKQNEVANIRKTI